MKLGISNRLDNLTMASSEKAQSVIISWNVDGYDHDVHMWLVNLIQNSRPDVIFLSETKRKLEDLQVLFGAFSDYNAIINVHIPWIWHGVVMLIRKDHIYEQVQINLNIPPRKDTKNSDATTGRVIAIKLDNSFFIVGSYTPNSGRGDPVKLNYRTRIWDPAFAYILDLLRKNGPTLWLGDINVALNDIDVSNPASMKTWAGFTPEERANFNTLLSTGDWIDIWRQQNPIQRTYTWLGYPHRPNYGMRLDNIIISASLLNYTKNAFMLQGSPISDHIPIGIHILTP